MTLQKQGLIGPFNFEKQHQISQQIWKSFTRRAETQDVDTHPLKAVAPLN
jgi:hypothetical protein